MCKEYINRKIVEKGFDNMKLCSNCKNLGRLRKCESYTRKNIYADGCNDYADKKLSNADRIRNMTNEELAEFIHNICTDFEDGEPILTLCLGENCDIEISDSYGDIKEWLESEAL